MEQTKDEQIAGLENKVKVLIGLLIVLSIVSAVLLYSGHTCVGLYTACATANLELVNTINNFNTTILGNISVP